MSDSPPSVARAHRVVCMAMMVLAGGATGCVTPEPSLVALPAAPGSVSAGYDLLIMGTSIGSATYEGMTPAGAVLGDGSQRSAPTATLRFSAPDPKGSGGHVEVSLSFHHRDARRLASVTLDCIVSPGQPSGWSCPGPTGARSKTLVPDAFDAPAFLGIGPFLGMRLAEGDAVTTTIWDPSGPVTVEWRVSEGPSWEGRACLTIASDDSIPSPKTPVPFAPTRGRILACDGVPLPVVVEQGPLALRLVDWKSAGAFVATPVEPSGMAADLPACVHLLPQEDETTLPVTSWLAWGRTEDKAVKEWFRAHPRGKALPAFGKLLEPPASSATVSSYYVSVPLVLHDRDGGTVFPRMAFGERSRLGPLPESSRMIESREIAGVKPARVDEPEPTRCAGEVALEHLADRVVTAMGFDARRYEAVVSPDVGAVWQGSWRALWPFEMLSAGATSELRPAEWPARLFVSVAPRGGAAVQLQEGAADPTTGWLRWLAANASPVG